MTRSVWYHLPTMSATPDARSPSARQAHAWRVTGARLILGAVLVLQVVWLLPRTAEFGRASQATQPSPGSSADEPTGSPKTFEGGPSPEPPPADDPSRSEPPEGIDERPLSWMDFVAGIVAIDNSSHALTPEQRKKMIVLTRQYRDADAAMGRAVFQIHALLDEPQRRQFDNPASIPPTPQEVGDLDRLISRLKAVAGNASPERPRSLGDVNGVPSLQMLLDGLFFMTGKEAPHPLRPSQAAGIGGPLDVLRQGVKVQSRVVVGLERLLQPEQGKAIRAALAGGAQQAAMSSLVLKWLERRDDR